MASEPANHRLSLVLRWAALAATIGVIAWLVVTRREQLLGLTRIDLDVLALVVAISLAAFVLNGVAFRRVVAPFGVDMTLTDATLLQFAVYTLNHLPMKGGTIAQGLMMRARHGVRLAQFVSLSAASQFASIWAILTFGGIALLVVGTHWAIAAAMLVAPYVGLAMLRIVARLGSSATGTEGRWRRAGVAILDGLRLLFGDARLISSLLLLNVLISALHAVRLYLILVALGAPVTVVDAAVIASVGSVAYTFSFVPGGLGFREGGIAAGGAAVGVSATLGFAAALVDRAVDLVIVLFVGAPATLYLLRGARAAAPEAGE